MALILLFSIFLKFSLVAYLYFIFPNPGKADTAIIAKVLELINQDRQKESLAPLGLNQVLSNSALGKANDLVSKDYFAHVSPDGKKPWDWVDRKMYEYSIVGENLAMNFTSAESVHKALMNSPSHKHNIMNEKYRDLGLAMVSGEIGGKQTNILVQLFSVQVERVLVKAKETDKPSAVVPVKTVEKETTSEKVAVLSSEKAVDIVKKNPTPTPTAVSKPPVKPNQESIPKLENTSDAKPELIKNTNTPKSPVIRKEEDVALLIVKPETKTDKIEVTSKTVPITNNDLQKENLASIKKEVKLIMHPGDQVLAQNVEAQIDQQLIDLSNEEKTLPALSLATEFVDNSHYFFSARLIKITQICMASILSLVIISLMINIFVRFEIQHKPVLIQTFLVMIFVMGLLFVNMHYLEGGAITIFMS